MDESEVVANKEPDAPDAPGELSCPVCERVVQSPAPEVCPHCLAPIGAIRALLETADLSLAEALRDIRIGDPAKALKRIESAAIISKSHRLNVELIKALVERLQGDPESALARLNSIDELLEEVDIKRDFRGQVAAAREQCLKDQEALARCCEHYNFALFQAKRGHFEESRRSLKKALLEVPWHPDSNALMGKVLLVLRETDEARYHLRRALASDPSNSTASRLLSELSKAEKLSGQNAIKSIAEWANRSPAWVGSIFIILILAVIAVVALISR